MNANPLTVLLDSAREMRERLDDLTPLAIPNLPLASIFDNLPGLRGLWLAGSNDNAGAAYDRSNQGRTLTLAGTPAVNIYNELIPYWDLDGAGDYHTRASEAALNITGGETTIASAIRGLTMGGWFWSDLATTDQSLIGKWDTTGNQRAYLLNLTSAGKLSAHVSSNGTADTSQDSAAIPAVGAWHLGLLRFVPGAELSVWLDNVEALNTTSIPATINGSSTAALQIGARNAGAVNLDGRWAVKFLCAAALTDALIDRLWRQSRNHFGA